MSAASRRRRADSPEVCHVHFPSAVRRARRVTTRRVQCNIIFALFFRHDCNKIASRVRLTPGASRKVPYNYHIPFFPLRECVVTLFSGVYVGCWKRTQQRSKLRGGWGPTGIDGGCDLKVNNSLCTFHLLFIELICLLHLLILFV